MPRVHLLSPGYIGDGVASSVSLIEADGAVIVVDPGMVRARGVILDPIGELGYQPDDVTDVIISHHHPDHTMNIALFPNASVHDHWATYRNDTWISRPAEGFEVAPGVTLWETPGHTPQDVTTIVQADDGVVALTHCWWTATVPIEDPYCTDPHALHRGRARVIEVATKVIPGHGPMFTPDDQTPR